MKALVPTVRAVACLHPFRMNERQDICLPAHLSIEQLLLRLGAFRRGMSYSVAVDGELVEQRVWATCYPDAFSTLAVRAVPAGGTSEQNKDMLQAIASIGIMVGVGALFGPGAAAAIMAGGALYLLGNIASPPDQEQKEPTNPRVSWQNNLNPYGTVPRNYGKNRMWPPNAALPHIHDGTYYAMFNIGYGRQDISDIKIGDESIDGYLARRTPENPPDASMGEYEVREGYTGEDSRNLTSPTVTVTGYDHPEYDNIPADEEWHEWYTELTEDMILKIIYPEGLGTKPIHKRWNEVKLRLWIRAKRYTGGEWVTLSRSENYGGEDKPQQGADGQYRIWSLTVNLKDLCGEDEPKRYLVAIKRGPNEYPGQSGPNYTLRDTVRVYAIHTLLWADPIAMENVATIAIKVPAEVGPEIEWNRINCVAHSYLEYWNGSDWIPGLTSQPAAIFADILRGTANTHPVASGHVDWNSIQDWAVWTDDVDHQYYFNSIFDRPRTVYQALGAVCAVARAAPVMSEAKFGVIWDRPQTEIVQHLTPRNTWGLSSLRTLPEKLHGIRMRYRSAENLWMDTERVAYLSGYDQDNATNIEEIHFWGCTDSHQADNLAWYRINHLRLRLEQITLSADIENLVCTRGDLVVLGHDVPLHASGWGRVVTVTLDGGDNCTGVVVDEQLYLDAAGYRLQVRSTKTTTPYRVSIQTPPITYPGTPGYVTTITFTSSIPPGDPAGDLQPKVCDLFIYGKSGIGLKYVEYLVAGVVPHEDLSATIELIEFQQASVFDPSTSGSYDPGITVPPYIEYMDPPQPVVLNVQTDEYALYYETDGSLRCAIVLTLDYQSGQYAPVLYLHCEWRRWSEDGTLPWKPDIVVGGQPNHLEIRGVEQGVFYELRLRTAAAHNRSSAWVVEDNNGEGIEVIGKSSAPPDPEGLYLDGDTIRWGYDLENAPLDFLGFEVRRHAGELAGWDYAKRVHSDVIKTSQWQISQNLYGTHTYYVKAVDTSHNYSTNAASAAFEFGEPEIANMQPDETRDWRNEEPEGWPGTLEGGYVHATGYLLASSGGPLGYLQMRYTTPHTPVDYQSGFWDAITLIYNTVWASNADSWWIEYRANETGWKWVPWPGLIKMSTVVDVVPHYQFRLTTAASPRQACVHYMITYQGTPNMRETIKNVYHPPSPGGPITIQLTKKMTHIVEVTGTIVSSPSGIHAIQKDFDPNVGGVAEIYVALVDETGHYRFGTVNWRVRGYRWRRGYDA